MSEEIFDLAKLQRYLTTKSLGRSFFYEQSLDSTNLRAKELARCGAPEGSLCLAEEQTAGRGRRGRSWHTPPGSCLAFSFLLSPACPPQKASMLSLVAGLATARALEGLGLSPQVKWPNDVVLGNKKICGILAELQTGREGRYAVIVGIGVNVNQEEFPEELQETATSLRLETGQCWEREQVLAAICNRFEEAYTQFLRTEDLSLVKEEYERLLANKGRQVRILEKETSFEGTALGITKNGELQVRLLDGTIREVFAGEVSVRGLYGYI